ncbi:hypothetical protein QBC46DRAFT_390815 [Diplogelasinospora grovesii]|uniref:DUF2828 domain-containing protein n=1 Tax=Diplogelasinospora grovesii TaxID=303347 RepID=A0AAN6S326_9PEZI|nr:hypothetical protein QBC46DRAFT_390815 [Diplogelasinospora grovesii]
MAATQKLETAEQKMETTAQSDDGAWFLKAKCPVYWPESQALTLSQEEFEAYVAKTIRNSDTPRDDATLVDAPRETKDDDTFTLVSEPTSQTTASEVRRKFGEMVLETSHNIQTSVETSEAKTTAGHPFMEGLLSHEEASEPMDMDNKMLTENADVAFRSTKSALVDLFYELEDVLSGPRTRELLDAAWKEDPLVTLKIIFNARSIHLGKSSRPCFYRCAGWLAKEHPLTLLANLRWLSRPVIEKKVEEKSKDADEMVVVEPEKDPNDATAFDVQNGVAHGYWKDLLNILALSANNKLDVLADSREVLNITLDKDQKSGSEDEAKEKRREVRVNRHEAAINAFKTKPTHQSLHLVVARLFAEQLKTDLALLKVEDAKAKRNVTFCAKWAPSTDRFHDKHTFVVSSIAEILYPEKLFASDLKKTGDAEADRTLYLRYAREAYRKDIAALRKHLEIVERDITAKTFDKIKYDRVPSIAMNKYSTLFATKDTDRFEEYIDKVADGKKRISGATLLPSTLIKAVREDWRPHQSREATGKKRTAQQMIEERLAAIDVKVVDGQWKTLVQRIKDSGTMDSSIAVCDVSGSMTYPRFRDGTCPMDSAIGLSLLLAEVTQPPFGGAFITFSSNPRVQKIALDTTLKEKYEALSRADWEMNTDFVAVFESLILPMAVRNKLAPEDMVKRVFVFSDMQFDSAIQGGSQAWLTSFERVQKAFKTAGYEMPELVFWNLAGGRAGYSGGQPGAGDPTAPKPVTAEQKGVALVSGYSQGMLKVFLDKGMFGEDEEDEEEEEVVEKAEEDEEMVTLEKVVKKKKINPLNTVKKAVSHKAYSMLRVVD